MILHHHGRRLRERRAKVAKPPGMQDAVDVHDIRPGRRDGLVQPSGSLPPKRRGRLATVSMKAVLDFVTLADRIEELLGTSVDLVSLRALKARNRDSIERDTLYV